MRYVSLNSCGLGYGEGNRTYVNKSSHFWHKQPQSVGEQAFRYPFPVTRQLSNTPFAAQTVEEGSAAAERVVCAVVRERRRVNGRTEMVRMLTVLLR